MTSRSSSTLALILVVFLLLVACAQQTPEEPPQQTPAQSPPAAEPSPPDQPSPEPEPEPETMEPTAATDPKPAASTTGDLEAGKAVYEKKCATCHGKDGQAKPAMAQMFKVEMRHLGSSEVQAKSDEELHRDIVEGIGKMKPITGLNDNDLANLVAYIRTLK